VAEGGEEVKAAVAYYGAPCDRGCHSRGTLGGQGIETGQCPW